MTQQLIAPAPGPLTPPPPVEQSPAPALPVQLTPRQLLLQKLCDRLEAGFNRHVSPNDKLDRFPSIQYVIIIVATHFKMREYVAQDPVIASTTVADLADKISDLQQLPADRLF